MPGNTAKYPTAAAVLADLTVATNQGETTLTSTINNSQTTMAVASVATFTAPCLVWIDNECIFVGTAASGSFTGCVRAFDNTTATSHASGITVANLISAYHVNQPIAEIIAIETDLKAGLPMARGGTDFTTATSGKTLVGTGTAWTQRDYLPALTGDVTTVLGSSAATLANIPADTPATKLLVTNVVAPSTPASGKTEVYVDATQKVLSAKNDAGSVSVTVVPASGTSGQFVTAVSAAGALSFGSPGASTLPQFTGGDVTTTTSGSVVLNLINIPTATPMAGSLLATAIVAPGTPASGKASLYVDSTDKNLKAKNDAGTITVSVLPVAGTSSKWLSALGTAGTFTLAQPAFSDLTGTLAASQFIGLTGDVVVTAGSNTATLTNIPSGVVVAGSELFTAIVAPGTPASGKGSVYVDSTSKNLAVKDDAGVVKHGVQTVAGTASKWITAISDAGSCTLAQPAYTDLTGTATTKTNKAFIDYKGALAQNGAAVLGFSCGTSGIPTATVVSGGNTILGVAAFTAATYVQDHFVLPTDWTSTIDVDIFWTAPDTSGVAVFSVALGAGLTNSTTVNPSFNAANTGTGTASNSANVINKLTISSLTTTNLAADNSCFFKFGLDSTTMSGATANVVGIRFTIRRLY